MIPNLDCMSPEELRAFWFTYTRSTRKVAAELIGDTRPGYTYLAKQLAIYADNKATALECRLRGDINNAQYYETICERVYDRLPEDLRW